MTLSSLSIIYNGENSSIGEDMKNGNRKELKIVSMEEFVGGENEK